MLRIYEDIDANNNVRHLTVKFTTLTETRNFRTLSGPISGLILVTSIVILCNNLQICL